MADRSARILSAIGREMKDNPPDILAKTRRKKGAAQAEKQRRAILLSKARRAGAAVAIVLSLLSGSVPAHDFYSGQKSPSTGWGCCNEVDCEPREVRLNPDTLELEIFIRDQWWLAQDIRWYLGPSPDGSWHGCMMAQDEEPRCVWGGGSA